MKPSYLTLRFFTETVAIIASVEAAIMFLLPVIAPGVDGVGEALLDVTMLALTAGPLILWRMNAAVKRANRGRGEVDAKFGAVPSNRLRRRVLVPLALALLVVQSVTTTFLASSNAENMERNADRYAEEISRRLRDHERMDVLAMQGLLSGISRSARLRDAFIARDRDATYRLMHESYESIKHDFGITHLYVHDVDRMNFLRVHEPMESGGAVNRWTLTRAAQTGAFVSGYESGKLGTFTLRCVLPWTVDGQVIGYLEMGKEFDQIAKQLGEQVVVVMSKTSLDEKAFRETVVRLGLLDNWDRFPNVVIAYGSIDTLPVALRQVLTEAVDLNRAAVGSDRGGSDENPNHPPDQLRTRSEIVEEDGHVLQLVSVLVADVQGQHAARLYLKRDITEWTREGRWAVFASSAWLLAIILGVLASGFLLLGRVETTLDQQAAKLMESEAGARATLAKLAAYRAALDEQTIIALTDLSGTITEVNEPFCRISGYSREELIGSDHRLLNSGHHPRAFWAEMWTTIVRGDVWQAEVCNKAKDGSLHWLDTTIGPIRDEEGNISGYLAVRIDITDRKHAEESLKRVSRQNKLLLNSAGEGLLGVDLDGQTTLANPVALRLLGYTSEELIGHLQHALIHHTRSDGSPYPRERCPVYAAFTDGLVHQVDSEVFWRKDGTNFTVDYTSTPIRDENGDLQGAVVVFRDITERKQAEDARRESEARYRFLFENMLNGFAYCRMIFEQDRPQDFIYLSVNSAFETLTGLKGVVGRNVSEVIPGIRETDPQLFDIYGRVARTGVPEKFETYLQALNMWFAISVYSPSKDHFVAVFDVITERKRAEETLRAAYGELEQRVKERTAELATTNRMLQAEIEERTRAEAELKRAKEDTETSNRSLVLLDQVNQALLTCGSLDELAHVVTEALVEKYGAYFARLWLIRSGDLCSECALAQQCSTKIECLHLLSSSGHYTHIDGDHRRVPLGAFKIGLIAQERGRTISDDVVNDERVHDRQWAAQHGLKSFAGLPLRRGGETIGVLAMFSQHALHPRILEVLDLLSHSVAYAITNVQQRDALATASRAKDEFLATMSHELRTPLNGVIGMTELLLQTELKAEQRRFAWLAKSSGDMLLALINDILDFSKIEAGRLELESTGFDLHYTIENVGACFSSHAASKNVELVCAVHPAVPSRLQGDPGRLQQILTNLVGNAIKFTDQGEVVVRVTKDEETDHDVTVRFTVTDTGIGIPSERVDRLFKSFSQIDSSTTRKYGGTGLGLAICKRLVEAMGGEIGVSSTEGCGSTFWFTIELAKLAEQADQPLTNGAASPPPDAKRPPFVKGQPPSLPDDIRRIRVLAVDDNATNREILHEQLAGWGFDHETTACGRDALSALRAAQREGRPFGLAIVDQQMPEMDGEQLAREIKQDPAVADTTLVLLISGLEHDEPERLMEIGFAGWLSKPALPSHLLDTLLEAFVCARTVSRRPSLEQDKSSRQSITGATSAGATILLAEDNEISQEVAATILTEAGYHCDVVNNGKEAVEAVRTGTYDLILMDCQMPEMDGFDAARAIRSFEEDRRLGESSAPRIPIIALTANALKRDRERCLDAGMDDYLSKPFDPRRLIEIIESKLSQSPVQIGADACASLASSAPAVVADDVEFQVASNVSRAPLDLVASLERWGHDGKLVARLLSKFENRAGADLQQLEQSVAAGDVKETARLAHGMKGAAAYVAGERLRDIARRLEEMALAADLKHADTCLSELRDELRRCLEFIPKALATLPASSASPKREVDHANPGC